MRWLRNLQAMDWLVIATGVLAALVLSPAGQIVALLGLISVIGIPIYFIVVLLPSAFLAVLAVWLIVRAWRAWTAGRAIAAAVFTLCIAVMADGLVFRAWRANIRIERQVDALLSRDKDDLGSRQPIDTLAVMRNTRSARDTDNPCDDLCQRLLLSGAVKRVLSVTAAPPDSARSTRLTPWPALTPYTNMEGTVWRLEKRESCADAGPPRLLRPVRMPAVRRSKGVRLGAPIQPLQLLRLKIARGTCLVGEVQGLSAADAVLAYGTLGSGSSAYRARWDVDADTISAWRVAFWRNEADRLVLRYQRTGLLYRRFPWVLIPTLLHGSGFEMRAGWLRLSELRNRSGYESAPPLASFVIERLALSLNPLPGAADGQDAADAKAGLVGEQGKAVDRIFTMGGATPQALTAIETKIVADYLSNVNSPLDWRGNGAGDADAARVLRIVRAKHYELPWQVQGAVRIALKENPSWAPALAEALFQRLVAIPAPPQGKSLPGRLQGQIRTLASALAWLPGEALAPYRSRIEGLMEDRERRVSAIRLLGKLDLFGKDFVPRILAMMDDARVLRSENAGDRKFRSLRRTAYQVWRAGLTSLCRLGPQAGPALPQVLPRVQAMSSGSNRAIDRLAVVTLLRLGASEDVIRQTLRIDPDDEKQMRSLDYAMRRAQRSNPCN
jgi:hypothetical protein